MEPEDVGARHGVDGRVDESSSHDDREGRHLPPPRGAELAVEAEFAPRAADHADSYEHRLLDDDDDDRGHDEGSVSQIGVEEVVRLVDHGLYGGLGLGEVCALGDQPLEFDHRAGLPDRRHQFLEYLPVHQEIAGVAVDRHVGLLAPVEILLVVRGDVDDSVYLAVEEELPGLLHRGRFVGHIGVRAAVERLDEAAARRRAALVDHADRDIAQHLRAVSQRVDRGIDQQREDQHQHDASVGENRPEFVADDSPCLLPV